MATHRFSTIVFFLGVLTVGGLSRPAQAQSPDPKFRFDFGEGKAAPGFVKVTPESI
jgi:hypothetical protein